MNKSSARRDPISHWSIGTKLTIIIVAMVIIPMSITAYYNLTQGQNEVAKIASENMMELSYGTALHIERILTENQYTSATLAGEPVVIEFLTVSGEDRQNLLPLVNQTLQNFADTHPDYDAPGILDVNGIVVASVEESLVGKNRSFRDYFQASIQGEPYVSGILVGRGTGRPGVFLTNPVITTQGEIVGIDIVWLKADTIWDITDGVVVGEEGITYLIDQDGVIIAHPNRELLYHSIGNLTPEAITTISETIRFGTVVGTDTPLIPRSLGMDDLAVELVSVQGSDTYRYYSTLDHRYHVVGYTRLESYPWTAVVDLPEAQYLAPLQRMKFVTWGSVGLAAVIALIISILLVRSITRPIRQLADAAIAVEHNRPFEPSDIKDVTSGNDEIAHLGHVFSSMVTTLRQELTERKRAEEHIKHLNSVLKAIRGVNQLIVMEKDRDTLLQKVCNTLTEARGYDAAWLGFLEDGEAFATVKGSGFSEDVTRFCEHVLGGDHPPCIRTALAQGEMVLVLDKTRECGDCFFKDACVGKEAAIIRVQHTDRPFGLLAILFAPGIVADEEEKELLKEVASDIAFALHDMELEEARKQAEEQIKASLKEKEVLLREIHHRVKNNLQVVSSLLNMQARAAKDDNTSAVLQESRDRLNTMALIHTKLYESGNLSEINMKGFVDGLIRQLFQGYQVNDTKIVPVVHVADCTLPISIAVPFGLVVNELLSNAFKHAFVNRAEGKIEVSLSASEKGAVRLTISDDGVGLPEGFDIKTTKTLGLHLVKILVEDQLQGNLAVISTEGTMFKIEFETEKNV